MRCAFLSVGLELGAPGGHLESERRVCLGVLSVVREGNRPDSKAQACQGQEPSVKIWMAF